MNSCKPLRLTVVASEFPYPPHHGGRSDIWRRLKAFHEAGVVLQLVCWYSPRRGGPPQPSHLEVVRSVVDDVRVLPIDLGPLGLLHRLINLFRWPSHVSARASHGGEWLNLQEQVRHFSPDAIWQDGLWGGVTAERLAVMLNRPRYVRSHNIEHRYMARQGALAPKLRDKFALWLTTLNLERFETTCLSTSRSFFDISVDDLAYWQARGLKNGHWLPTTLTINKTELDPAPIKFDVGFVGNLHTPNNVDGLLWFLAEVWPRVCQQKHDAIAVIAGSNPSARLVHAVDKAINVSLVANPVDAWSVYRSARVLVNPVRHGSGVNIKSIEMLHLDRPVVSTSVGVGGVPQEVRESFIVENDASRFAQRIVESLNNLHPVNMGARQEACKPFGQEAIMDVIRLISGNGMISSGNR